jgi:hypothetical protein
MLQSLPFLCTTTKEKKEGPSLVRYIQKIKKEVMATMLLSPSLVRSN